MKTLGWVAQASNLQPPPGEATESIPFLIRSYAATLLTLGEDRRWPMNRILTAILVVVLFLASSIHLWSQETIMPELLSKKAQEIFQSHARDLYYATNKLEADLRLSIAEERVLLHLPKRGFPHLASLLYNVGLSSGAQSFGFPDRNLKTCSREEYVAGELLARAMVVRLATMNYACFRLVKELATTPEAMKCEAQAKELSARLFPPRTENPTEAEFLHDLESIRALFDQLRDLPKLTAGQLADERAESAALAYREYRDGDDFGQLPKSGRQWADRELKWHRKWDHQRYLLAYSEFSGPKDFEQFKMVINLRGGIFEWNRLYSGSHSHPDSYESKLTAAEFRDLKDFLTKLPLSDETGEKNHFVVSFLKDGRWTTRTYDSLPTGNPFPNLLERMVRQSVETRLGDSAPDSGFLKIYP